MKRLFVIIVGVIIFISPFDNLFGNDKNIELLAKGTLERSGFNVQSVKIADGRAEGGIRMIIITYIITNNKDNENKEIISILGQSYGINNKLNADIDEVSAVVGDKNGKSIAIISVKISSIGKLINMINDI